MIDRLAAKDAIQLAKEDEIRMAVKDGKYSALRLLLLDAAVPVAVREANNDVLFWRLRFPNSSNFNFARKKLEAAVQEWIGGLAL